MPKCTNVPIGCSSVYYRGIEKTPLGLGLSPRYESIGTIHIGRDGKRYIVGFSGVNKKRWVLMWWVRDDR